MKIFKWLSLGLLTLLAVVVLAAVLAPWLFADRIRGLVDEQIEKFVDADVVYGDVELSMLRDFPNLAVGIDSVAVTGRGTFDSLELVRLDRLDVGLGFWSLFGGGPVEVHNVELLRPRIHVVVLRDSSTNTDILRDTGTATPDSGEAGAAEIELERYAVIDGALTYDDRLAGLFVEATGLNHSGSGDFTATRFALDTETELAALTLESAGVPYLKAATLDYDAVLQVDTEAGTVTLDDNVLRLNELALEFTGMVGLPQHNGDIAVDLAFAAPQQDFRALWSVVPAAFAKTLDGVQTGGAFQLGGAIVGTYVAATGGLPGFDVRFGVDDGRVQYPDLPKALNAINIEGEVQSDGGDLADLLIDIPRFAFRLGDDPFSGKLRVRNGTTDPAFDLEAKGRVDLGQVQQAFPIEGVERLAGLIDLDVAARGTASDAEAGALRAIESSGTARVSDVVYVGTGTPAIAVASGEARFDGSRVALTGLNVRAGRSDLAVDGSLTDPFAVVTDVGTLGGDLKVRGSLLDANEWLAPTAPAPAGTETLPPARPFDRFAIGFDAGFDRVLYDVYDLTDVRATGRVTPDELTLTSTSFETAGSDVAMSGQLQNLFGFTYDEQELTGSLEVRSRRLDLLALSSVGVDPTAPAAAAAGTPEYIELPERMSIAVDARVGELLYDDITLRNVSGTINLADQKAAIADGRGDILGGKVAIDGGYTYRGPTVEPTFDLKYALTSIGFKEAFEQFNTVERLAPVAQYLTGKFSTEMVMSSTLGPDMLPNLMQLDADGVVNTINAALEGFGPLRKAGDMLGVSALQNLRIGNTKNWFTIENGFVTLRPFDVEFDGIRATIGGSHGLSQEMRYEILARIPRAMLGKNAVGAAANQGLAALQGQASRLGLNLDVGEFVNVRIGLTGSINDPKIDLKLVGTEGTGTVKDAAAAALKDVAQQARDSVQRLAEARLDAARADAERRARAVADSVRSEAAARAQALAADARAKAAAETNRLAEEAKARASAEAQRAADAALKQQGEAAKEKARNALQGILKKPGG